MIRQIVGFEALVRAVASIASLAEAAVDGRLWVEATPSHFTNGETYRTTYVVVVGKKPEDPQ